MQTTIDSGLSNVVVAETELSHVDGELGELVIRGHRLEDLAGVHRFAEVCGLLWHGRFDEGRIAELLGRGRAAAFARLPELGAAVAMTDGMDALRAGLAHFTEAGEDDDERATRLVAAIAVLGAAWQRQRRGLAPVVPDPERDHAADVLAMTLGRPIERAEADALDAYLVTVCDHGMNASTFAARVVTSTGSDAVSAMVAAIGALKGPLHGGAPGPVLDMLDAIGDAANAEPWVRSEVSGGRRIMGMGHRIYRVRDPRAAVLERAMERLEVERGRSPRLTLARAVETAAERVLAERYPERPLRANVEFYTAVLLEAIGIDRAQITPTFAAGRAAGWWAHVREQRAAGRLIRPKSTYVGPR